MKLLLMICNVWREELTNSNGRLMASASTEPHVVWLKLMIPCQRLTQAMPFLIISQFHGLGNAYTKGRETGY